MGPLSLLCFCLANGSHELNRQTLLYHCNFKAALYLTVCAMDTEGKGNILFHITVASLVPFLVQIVLMDYDPNGLNLDGADSSA